MNWLYRFQCHLTFRLGDQLWTKFCKNPVRFCGTLSNEFVRVLSCENDWLGVSRCFAQIWSFFHCIGSVCWMKLFYMYFHLRVHEYGCNRWKTLYCKHLSMLAQSTSTIRKDIQLIWWAVCDANHRSAWHQKNDFLFVCYIIYMYVNFFLLSLEMLGITMTVGSCPILILARHLREMSLVFLKPFPMPGEKYSVLLAVTNILLWYNVQ